MYMYDTYIQYIYIHIYIIIHRPYLAPEWNHQQPAAKRVAMSKWSTQHGTGFLASALARFKKVRGTHPNSPKGRTFQKARFNHHGWDGGFSSRTCWSSSLAGNWETHSPCFSQKKRGSPCILFNSGNGGFEANLKIWKSPLLLVAFGSWHTADHFFYEPCTAGATLPVNPWDKPFVGTTITGMPRHMKSQSGSSSQTWLNLPRDFVVANNARIHWCRMLSSQWAGICHTKDKFIKPERKKDAI